MKFASHAQDAPKSRHIGRTEAVVIFTVANQTFAIAADAVQEIRSTDSLGEAAMELEDTDVPKVRHSLDRGRRTWYVVNAAMHFGLRVTRPTLLLILRQIRAAILVDGIERMAELSAVYALPRGFSGEERLWYRGLAYLEDRVIPVIQPDGFLAAGEFERLDRATAAAHAQREMEGAMQP